MGSEKFWSRVVRHMEKDRLVVLSSFLLSLGAGFTVTVVTYFATLVRVDFKVPHQGEFSLYVAMLILTFLFVGFGSYFAAKASHGDAVYKSGKQTLDEDLKLVGKQ